MSSKRRSGSSRASCLLQQDVQMSALRSNAALPHGRLLKVDPVALLASSNNASIAFFARRDLLGVRTGAVSTLWDLPEARRIAAKQNDDGSWHYPGARSGAHSREKYDQLETFRQAGTLVEKFGFTGQ